MVLHESHWRITRRGRILLFMHIQQMICERADDKPCLVWKPMRLGRKFH